MFAFIQKSNGAYAQRGQAIRSGFDLPGVSGQRIIAESMKDKRAATENSTGSGSTRFGYDFSHIPVQPTVRAPVQDAEPADSSGQTLGRAADRSAAYTTDSGEKSADQIKHESPAGMGPATLADWLPQTRGTFAASATVLLMSGIADRDGVKAVTRSGVVHLSSGLSRLPLAEQQRTLAHEAIHVAQLATPGSAAPRGRLEGEARRLSPQLLAGLPVCPQFHAEAMLDLADDGGPLPNDTIAVQKAKARREVLLRYKAIYEGSQSPRLVAAERQNILEKRERLDESMAKRLKESEKFTGQKSRAVAEYQEQEKKNLAALNRKPITLEVTTMSIRIRARFQVRFEGLADKEAAQRFPILKQNFEQGVRDTWNQKLRGAVLPGRTFEVIPELTLVSSTAARNENFWLITVRPTDAGPLVYEKKSWGQAPGGVPTSVTDPLVDSGVMSIPPSHIEKPDILGHETLHLFGLVDRYTIVTIDKKPEEFSLRDTQGRPDPLGADEETGKVKGKILEEDLGFVLDQLGVYPTMPYNDVLAELKQVEEIIKTGRDPNSLIRKRKNFEPEMVKQTEDLP